MLRAWFFCCASLLVLSGNAQSRISEQTAKSAVYRIVRYSGLQPDFIVRENAAIPTAIAFIKGHKRCIEYNPSVIAGIMDSARTDWSAVSILAHEIAHHLLGHTLETGKRNPGDELSCDLYSGFILNAMGATLDESLAAMRVVGHKLDTLHHPSKEARLEAIRQGWKDRDRISRGEDIAHVSPPEDLHWSINFEGDPNTYYVNANDQLVWFNELAQPIVLGNLEASTKKAYQHTIRWNSEMLQVDGRGSIWSSTTHGMMTPVGHMSLLGER